MKARWGHRKQQCTTTHAQLCVTLFALCTRATLQCEVGIVILVDEVRPASQLLVCSVCSVAPLLVYPPLYHLMLRLCGLFAHMCNAGSHTCSSVCIVTASLGCLRVRSGIYVAEMLFVQDASRPVFALAP